MENRSEVARPWCCWAQLLLISSILLAGCTDMLEPQLVVDFHSVDGELPLPESYQARGLVLPSEPVLVQPSPGEAAVLSSDIASADLHAGPLPLVFTAPQRWVDLTLAPAPELPAGTTAELRGYDQAQAGMLVANRTIVLDPVSPVAVRLAANGDDLRRIELEYAGDGVERVSKLQASTAGSPPPADSVPPEVEILVPTAGQALISPERSVQLELSVSEAVFLRQVTATVGSGLSRTRVELCGPHGGLCPGAPPDFSLTARIPAFAGRNLVTVDVEDLAGNRSSASRDFRLLPGLAWDAEYAAHEEQPLKIVARDLPSAPPLPPQPTPGETYELLVLVPEALDDWRMLVFVAHKLDIGTSTYVRTVEQIDADPRFSEGRDIQERIKLAIRHFHEEHQTRYVLLVGDVDQFPVRYTRVWDGVYAGHFFMPSDLYYADLYDLADDDVWDQDSGGFDAWDANGNSLFGESGRRAGNPRTWSELNVDQVDLKPDVAVGRIPASDTAELGRMMAKIIRYERSNAPSDHPGYLALTGNWVEDQARGASEWIRHRLDDLGQPAATFYAPGAWDDLPDLEWRGSTVNSELNLGKAFVTHFGHGAFDAWADWYGDVEMFTMNRTEFLGELDEDGLISQVLRDEFQEHDVQLGPTARVEAGGSFEWTVSDGLRRYLIRDKGWNLRVYPGSFIPSLENNDRLPVVFAASCDTAMFHFPDMPYQDVNGQEYNCNAVDPEQFDGDASFLQARIFPGDPSVFTLFSTNLDPTATVEVDDSGLFVTGEASWSVDNLFRLTAPLVDPRDYWYSLRSQNYPNHYLRHRLFRAELTEIESTLDRKDATFRIVPGLGDPDTVTSTHEYVSFESWNYPGYFLVEIDGKLYLRERGVCDADFNHRATFRVRSALSGAQNHYSFESLVGEGRYIRHRDFRLRVEEGSGELFEEDSSFRLVGPRYDPTPDYGSFARAFLSQQRLMARQETVQVGPVETAQDELAATVRILPGLSDTAYISLEALVRQDAPLSSFNRMHPSHFVRHFNFQLKVDERLPKNRLNRAEPAAVQQSMYDLDSLAERFTVKHDGGAIAYLAPHSTTQPFAIDYVRKFFGALEDASPGDRLGDLWVEMVRGYIEDEFDRIPGYLDDEDWYAGAIYLNTQKMMFFGDPSLRLQLEQ